MCEYCDDKDGFKMLFDTSNYDQFDDSAIYLVSRKRPALVKGYVYYNDGYTPKIEREKELPIAFCPFCGKRLTYAPIKGADM